VKTTRRCGTSSTKRPTTVEPSGCVQRPRLEGDGRLVRTMRFGGLDELEAGRADLEAAVRAWCDLKR
jgi:hypothetical protein